MIDGFFLAFQTAWTEQHIFLSCGGLGPKMSAYVCMQAVLTLCSNKIFFMSPNFHFYMFPVVLPLPATFTEFQTALTDKFVSQRGGKYSISLGWWQLLCKKICIFTVAD